MRTHVAVFSGLLAAIAVPTLVAQERTTNLGTLTCTTGEAQPQSASDATPELGRVLNMNWPIAAAIETARMLGCLAGPQKMQITAASPGNYRLTATRSGGIARTWFRRQPR